MIPGTVRRPEDVEPETPFGAAAQVRRILTAPHYAEALEHRTIDVASGTSALIVSPAHDELVYVLGGRARLRVGEEQVPLEAGTAALLLAGETWRIEDAESLQLADVLVPAPPGPAARALAVPTGDRQRTARLGGGDAQQATCGRQFEVLFDASRGSRGATQFVGFIPQSGAPAHFHLYDEICVIVRGTGILHANGTEQPLGAGAAFHVAPRMLHSLENTGAEDLWVLGVFRPAGSAAAAYYPDGRPAPGHDPE